MTTPPVGSWTDLSRPPLRIPVLRAALTVGDRPTWRAVDVVPRTGSTNADLAERARAGEEAGLVLTTDHQTAGRGRMAREWETPARSSVAVSVLLRPTAPIERWGWLSLMAGVAVVRALTSVGGLPAVLKWPNDVLVPEPGDGMGQRRGSADHVVLKKVCGILAEVITTPTGPAVVLGAGINVSQSRDELPVPQATSLRLAGAAVTDRDTVLRAYLRELATLRDEWDGAAGDPRRSGLGAAYREACVTIGRQVELLLPGRDPLVGLADGVDDDGRLMLRDDEGHQTAHAAGDVVHVRPS
jgi:BirA family biotin operon repressor/biotin-[acetyl-CoA-carboxylase] ligase